MGLTLSQNSGGGDFEVVPAGSYIARCYSIVDLGTQKVTFQGETKEKPQVVLSFEILDDDTKRQDGTPFVISKTFTASLDSKASLRKTLDGWRGRPFTEAELKRFELATIAGAYAQITVSHSQSADGTKNYADLVSISPLHKSIPKPAPVNAVLVFDMAASGYLDDYAKLPKWQQKKVEASREWTAKPARPVAPATAPAPAGTIPPQGADDDDIPF